MSKFDAQFAGRLDGQTVLVTGAKGGIGYETAQGIGNSGATVLVHARRADEAQRAVDQLVTNGNGRYLPIAGDLGSLAGVRELVGAVREVAPKGLTDWSTTRAPRSPARPCHLTGTNGPSPSITSRWRH